jgi:hypothetical protein
MGKVQTMQLTVEEAAHGAAEGGVRVGYPPGGTALQNASERVRPWWRRVFGL